LLGGFPIVRSFISRESLRRLYRWGDSRDNGNKGDGIKRLPYQAYFDQRKILIEGQRESTKTFDQAMLTLPAAALGITVAFMRDIAPHPVNIGLLISGWFSLGIAILASLASLLTSQKSYEIQIAILDDELTVGCGNSKLSNPDSQKTKCLNYVCMGLFALGITLVLTFAVTNLPSQQGGSEVGEQAGTTIPVGTAISTVPNTGFYTSEQSVAATTATITSEPTNVTRSTELPVEDPVVQ
jgi:hypothetical protein